MYKIWKYFEKGVSLIKWEEPCGCTHHSLMLCKLLSALDRLVLTTDLNHLASLAKWFCVRLQTGCGFESHYCHLRLLIQKLLKYIKNNF